MPPSGALSGAEVEPSVARDDHATWGIHWYRRRSSGFFAGSLRADTRSLPDTRRLTV
jgi:hypothetical protein